MPRELYLDRMEEEQEQRTIERFNALYNYADYLSLRRAYIEACIESKKSFEWNGITWDKGFAWEVLELLGKKFMEEDYDEA